MSRVYRNGNYPPHYGYVDPEEEETFLCEGCSEHVPMSKGHADNRPELCDDCWQKAEEREDGAIIHKG